MQSKSSDAAGSSDYGVSGANKSASPTSSSPTPPCIPEYELLRRIGSGSYGEVWLARNAVGTLRAIKVVYRQTFATDRPYDREFSGIKKFEPISRSHEGLIDVLHVGRSDEAGYFYYVMELADPVENPNEKFRNPKEARIPNAETDKGNDKIRTSGFGLPAAFDIRHSDLFVPRTLKHDLQQRGRLPIDECLQLGLALTSAVAHLHKHGLVHRDIKPSNIIFVNGMPKLADIGLVAGADEAKSYVGTEGYIPPEGPGTAQADLYSLGKVLYELSTGKDRHNFPEPLTALGELDDQSRLLELNAVIHKACRPEIRNRYQTAEAMHADLALLQSGQSVRRLRVVERRLAILTKTSLVVSALLGIAATAYFFAVSQTRRAERERRHSDQLLYAADMSVAQQALEAGNLLSATALLEGHRPKPGREDLRGFEWYYLKNLCRGDETHTFHGHEQPVLSVAISPDGGLLASSGEDRTIQLWDLASQTNVATLRGHTDAINALAFSRDGTRLASGSADKTVKLWDVATRTVFAEFTNHAAAITSVAFSPDGKWLAVGTDGTSAKLWDIATGQELRELVAPDNASKLVTVSPDGRLLAIGGKGSVVRLWELPTLRPAGDLYEEAGFANGMAFSPDSRILATTRSDGIYLWEIATLRVVGKLRGHEAEVHPVAFSPDGKTLATGSVDYTVRLWDLSSRQAIRIFKGHKDSVRSVAFSPDGQRLISASMDHDVKLWELSPTDTPDVLRGHTDGVQGVAFSPDDKLLATASLDGTVKLWDVTTGTNIATFTGHTAGVTGVAFSHDGATLISCSLDKTIRFWNATTGEQLATYPGEERLSCLALSPDGGTLAVGGGWWNERALLKPSVISFWDLASRQPLTNHVGVHDMVRTLSFSSDGKTLAVGMGDDSLELVDAASKRSFFFSTNLASEVAWSPGDETLAVSDETDWIGLFDITTRRISRRIQMPSAGTRYGASSPDGKTLAIFYTTTKIKLCNVVTGREVATLQGHEGFGLYLAFSHDGQTLATASYDRTVRLWRAPRK